MLKGTEYLKKNLLFMIIHDITLLFKEFVVIVSTSFLDPECECKIILPHDQAGGASYGAEGVSDKVKDDVTRRAGCKTACSNIYSCFHVSACFFQRWKCSICVIRGWIPTNAGQWLRLILIVGVRVTCPGCAPASHPHGSCCSDGKHLRCEV